MNVDIDGVRFRDITPFSLTILGVGALIVGAATVEVMKEFAAGDVTGGLVMTGLTLVIAGIVAALVHSDLKPEIDAVCATCGDHITAHRGHDSTDEYVVVKHVGEPDRASVNGFSFVAQPQKTERAYCSARCAAEDDKPLAPDRPDTVDERTATNSGEHDAQGDGEVVA